MKTVNSADARSGLRSVERGVRKGSLERLARYAAYVYIGLPVLIFLLGWIRPQIAIPLALAVLVSFALCFRGLARTPFERGRAVPVSTLVGVLLLICVWVYLSGIGGLVSQNSDHNHRNQMFKILIEHSWPPSKLVAGDTGFQTVFFSYYLGFWLPAALFGKVFGLHGGFIFQYAWSVLGLCILFVLIFRKTKKYCISTLLIFALFSGLDILGCLLAGSDIFAMSFQEHIEWWSGYQFSSHSTMLFWVFNQAIYGWLLTALLLNEEDNRRVILIWSCGLLECTFPFVGMIPFLAYRIINNIRQSGAKPKDFFKWTDGLFSVENILGGGVIGIVSFLYLQGNSASLASRAGFPWDRPAELYTYLVFILVEAGVYFIAIYPYQKKNPLFWIALVSLLICPVVRIGRGHDFCMRTSIPALMVLCLLVIESLRIARRENRRRYIAILALFLIGTVTPMHEILRTSAGTFRIRAAGGSTINYVTEDDIFKGANFVSDVRTSRFAKYFTNLRETWNYGTFDSSGGVVDELTDDRPVEQRFIMAEDVTLNTICVKFGTYMRTNDCSLRIVIEDDKGKENIVGMVDCSEIVDNATRYINLLPYIVEGGRWYSLKFIPVGASKDNSVTIYRSAGEGEDWEYAVIDGEPQDFDLAVAFGRREVTKDEGSSTGRRIRHALQRGIPVQAQADD